MENDGNLIIIIIFLGDNVLQACKVHVNGKFSTC